MKVKVYGAAGEVTGSSYNILTEHGNVLVDFGMFQGGRMAESRNKMPPDLNVGMLKAVLLTHAHLDHIGRLPFLGKTSYEGPIYATPATIDLARLILEDSAKIQQYDAERWNRKRARQGLDPVEPIYSYEDVERIMGLMQPVEYDKPIQIVDGITVRFAEAGHLLGSTSIEVVVDEKDLGRRRVVFSGDIGPNGVPLLQDSEPFSAADLVFLESTYGDRNHRPLADTIEEFESIIKEAVANKSKILMPTFAVGRAQLMIFLLGHMFRKGIVPKFPIYLDSPMAVEATRIFGDYLHLMDEDFHELLKEKPLREDLDQLEMVVTAQESIKLNDISGPCLIMAGSGMSNAGRILHHYKINLSKTNTVVIIVGYQASGSLGRQLVDGPPREVSIFGKRVPVGAKVYSLGGFSAHADQAGLLKWLHEMAIDKPTRVVLTHGENGPRAKLAELIQERYDIVPEMPSLEDVID